MHPPPPTGAPQELLRQQISSFVSFVDGVPASRAPFPSQRLLHQLLSLSHPLDVARGLEVVEGDDVGGA